LATFFKVVVLGDGGIGKTSICNYLTTGEFFGSYKLSIGADFFSKKLVVDGEDVTLQICDIGGQDQFAEISNIFTKGAHGAILCYDTTRRDTLDSLSRWLLKLDDPNIPKVLVSTKNDVEDLKEVLDEEGLQTAQKFNIPYYIPTSSLKGIGITETFEAISRLMLLHKKGYDLPSTSTIIDTSQPKKPEVFTITSSQHISAQPLGIGRVPTASNDHLEKPAPPAPQPPVSFEPPTVQEPEVVIPTVEAEEEIRPSFIEQPTPLSPPIIRENEKVSPEKETIVPTPQELQTIEPPTEPEKTATQPFSAIAPPITPQPLEEEKVEEKKEEKPTSDFSFLDRLRKEREKLEKEKQQQL